MRNADAGGDYELKVITDIDGQLPIPCVKEFSMFIKACLYVFIAICSIGSSGTVRASAMPYTPQDLASPSTATAVVMSYNIRLDTPADMANAWPHRRNFLTSQIALLRPEILGLQEVLHNQKIDLQAALPNYIMVGGGRDDGGMSGEYVPIAIDTRVFLLEDNGQFWLSPTPDIPSIGWDASFKRVVVWARVRHRQSGQAMLVLNTHWDHMGQVARWESGRLMAHWLGLNRKYGEAVIVMGDFNTAANTPALAQLTVEVPGAPILTNAQSQSETPTIGPKMSFNAFSIRPEDGDQIDHIFISAPFRVTHYATIAQHDGERVTSDHFPVVAMLEWPMP